MIYVRELTYASVRSAHIEKGRARFIITHKILFRMYKYVRRILCIMKIKRIVRFFVLFRALIERRAPHQRLSCDCAFFVAFFRFAPRSLSDINYCLYWLLKVRL